MRNYRLYFKDKKILITGHTGFKGSWMTLWLNSLGAKILGVSKNIPTSPSHYKLLNFKKNVKFIKRDIKNPKSLNKIIKNYKPDYIFHLAAQSIVKKSYLRTFETWETNLLGTVNLLESLKNYKKKITVVIITSDKAYKNIETSKGYKEDDLLGGIDPYGASKSAAELAIQSYVKSFFNKKKNISIAVARAGNVIGGGDWSENRLVPDCIKSWLKKKVVTIRSPNSTRPWQHVLEVINGYLILAIKLKLNKKLHGESFNFGPEMKKNFKVIEVLKSSKMYWNTVNWKIKNKRSFYENKLLNLNSNKAKKYLNWKPVLSFADTIKLTIEWYRGYAENKKDIYKLSLNQINYFQKLLK